MLNFFQVDKIILNALEEDIGTGDITTNSTIGKDVMASGRFIAIEDGIICGLDIAARVFFLVDRTAMFKANFADGESVKKGEIIATIEGRAANLLTAERTALNLLQRMSGIATITAYYAKQLEGTGAAIADTRKTTPSLRVLEKYAVKTGGGTNHRFNLADGILIKDNHIAANGGTAAGGIRKAVESARKNSPHTLKIEVECETMDDIKQALEARADIIMLDNMTTAQMREAVQFIGGRALTEASGNMDKKNLLEVAACGVNIISMGALTHSVKSMDISLKFNLT